jgi:hypothetical protein
MSTLFLSAPKSKAQSGTHHRDFYTILGSGIGPDYGIYPNLFGQICPGMKAVVFDRDRQKRAEGAVVNYTPTMKAGNGVQRYDVQIRNLMEVAYANPPKVNYFGVAIN